jgi:hypothetical protein
MKVLFLLLLLANIALFAWFSQRPAPEATSTLSAAPVPPGVARLQRLQDLDDQQQALISTPTVTFQEPYCFRIGPLEGVASGRALRDDLAKRVEGLDLQLHREEYRELSGYWVFLPPQSSRSEAIKLTRQLKEKGIKDYLIVPNGPKRNAISLGFFRQQDTSRRHFARLRELGFSPELEESYRTGERFWLDFVSYNSNPLPDELIREMFDQYRYEVSRRDCVAEIRSADGQISR